MINLLPPIFKKRNQEEQCVRLTIILGLLALLFFVCLSLLFLAIRIYVHGELEAQEITIGIRQKEVEEQQSPVAHIRSVNQNITKLTAFYEERVILSETLAEITRAMPQELSLTSFQYNAGKISVAGLARSTEDLLALKEALEGNSRFSNFFFPPSNWANPTASNIDFSFTFETRQP